MPRYAVYLGRHKPTKVVFYFIRSNHKLFNLMEKEIPQVEVPVETTSEVEIAPDASQETIDYKEALAEALVERENYKQMGLTEKQKRKDLEDQIAAGNPPQTVAPEFPDIDALVSAKVEAAVSQITTKLAEPNIDALIAQMTTNADEAALIKLHFETSTVGSDMKVRLDNARILANGKLIQKKLSEIKRVKDTVIPQNANGGTGDAKQAAPTTTTDGWSAEQAAWMKKRGLDPNKVKQNLDKSK